MRIPSDSVSNAVRLTFGRYVMRRARRAKLPDFEAEAKAASDDIKAAEAAQATAEEARQDALADRDAADDDLDDLAKRHRQTIEGRATNANRERPYTDIYPDGVEHYTAAPLKEQEARYALLTRRYDEFLPEGDAVRAESSRIKEALGVWSAALSALTQAETEVALAKGRALRAEQDWEATMNRLYFRLAERFGKTVAERFFPRARRGAKEEASDAAGPGPTT